MPELSDRMNGIPSRDLKTKKSKSNSNINSRKKTYKLLLGQSIPHLKDLVCGNPVKPTLRNKNCIFKASERCGPTKTLCLKRLIAVDQQQMSYLKRLSDVDHQKTICLKCLSAVDQQKQTVEGK